MKSVDAANKAGQRTRKRLLPTTVVVAGLSLALGALYVVVCLRDVVYEITDRLNWDFGLWLGISDMLLYLALAAAAVLGITAIAYAVIFGVLFRRERDPQLRYALYRRFMVGIGSQVLCCCFLAYYGNCFSILAFNGFQVAISVVISAVHAIFFMLVAGLIAEKQAKKTAFPPDGLSDKLFAIISGLVVCVHWVGFLLSMGGGHFEYMILYIVFLPFPLCCGVLFAYLGRLAIAACLSSARVRRKVGI